MFLLATSFLDRNGRCCGADPVLVRLACDRSAMVEGGWSHLTLTQLTAHSLRGLVWAGSFTSEEVPTPPCTCMFHFEIPR